MLHNLSELKGKYCNAHNILKRVRRFLHHQFTRDLWPIMDLVRLMSISVYVYTINNHAHVSPYFSQTDVCSLIAYIPSTTIIITHFMYQI